MEKIETNFFNKEDLEKIEKPGEYGTKDKPVGWTCFKYKNRMVFLTSLHYSEKNQNKFSQDFYKKYDIPVGNTIDLSGVQVREDQNIEIDNKAKAVLDQFKNQINKIKEWNKNILIHCKHGLNRTPVGAVVYLLKQGETRDNAERIVNEALKKRHFEEEPPKMVDYKGMYSSVLKAAEKNPTLLNINTPSTVDLANSSTGSNLNSDRRLRYNNRQLRSVTTQKPQSSVTSTSISNASIRSNQGLLCSDTTDGKRMEKKRIFIRPSEVKEIEKEKEDFLKGEIITKRLRSDMKKLREEQSANTKKNNNNSNTNRIGHQKPIN